MPRQMNKWQLLQLEKDFRSNNLTGILKLPEEIRGLIIEKLDQGAALNLRLVCQQLRVDVEKYFCFGVRFHETVPVMPWFSSLRIRYCRIIIPVNASRSNLVRGIRLQHPPAIRRLEVIHPLLWNLNTNEELLPSVCPEIYTELLRSCSEHVRDLSLTFDSRVLLHDFPFAMAFQFPNLSNFNATVRVPRGILTPAQVQLMGGHNMNGLFQQLLLQSETLKLHSIGIDLQLSSGAERLELLLTVLRCLGKFRTMPLRRFRLLLHRHSMDTVPVLQLPNILSVNEMNNFSRIDSLEKVRMDYVAISDDESCWRKLLVNQRKLRSLHLKSLWKTIPSQLIRELITRNGDTLVKIFAGIVKSVTNENGIERPFDFSIFQRCLNLQTLTLSSSCLDVLVNGQASLVNLNSLPHQVRELSLAYYEIETAELLRLGETINNLQSLTIKYGGTRGVLGVTGSVINHMMTNVNLKYINFKELNVSDETENDIVNTIVELYGLPSFPYNVEQEIILCRDDGSMEWHKYETQNL